MEAGMTMCVGPSRIIPSSTFTALRSVPCSSVQALSAPLTPTELPICRRIDESASARIFACVLLIVPQDVLRNVLLRERIACATKGEAMRAVSALYSQQLASASNSYRDGVRRHFLCRRADEESLKHTYAICSVGFKRAAI